MNNRADIPSYRIFTAQAMLKDRYGVEMNPDLFLEWARDAVRRIGFNIDTIKVKTKAIEDGFVYLPCEAFVIRAVTVDWDVFGSWSAVEIGEDNYKIVNNMGGVEKDHRNNPNVLKGNSIDFEVVGNNVIQVSKEFEDRDVYVLVDAKITDAEGYPMVTEKQASAICDWCAFIFAQRNAFAGKKGMDVMYMKTVADMAIAGARVEEYVSDNEWDDVLDAKVSFGRKSYNRPFNYGHGR
jgi:hypothetical protein